MHVSVIVRGCIMNSGIAIYSVIHNLKYQKTAGITTSKFFFVNKEPFRSGNKNEQ